MLQLITTGFMIGLLGSFHCIGMCGPLALSLPLKDDRTYTKITGALLYNTGRITTYSFAGLLFGMIGQSVALFGYQQWLSILLGAGILIFILSGRLFSKPAFSMPFINHFFVGVRTQLGKLYYSKNNSSLYLIGLLNGLLPCGLVYMAITGSIATGNVLNSVIFMASFGLGTLPVMWSVIFFGNYISISIRQKIRMLYPYLMMLMACMLILRGMGLGIPYISPALHTQHELVPVYCCPNP